MGGTDCEGIWVLLWWVGPWPGQSVSCSDARGQRMIFVPFQGKAFNITVIQVYAPTTNTEEAEVEWFCDDLQDLLELMSKKGVLFIIGYWNASMKSRNTWSNRQIWPWNTEWSRAKANRVLPWEHTGHNKHPIPTTQEKTLYRDITRCSIPKSDWLYSLQQIILIIFFAAKDGEGLYSQQKQDWKLTVAQIMNSLLPNSDLNWRKKRTPLAHSGMT